LFGRIVCSDSVAVIGATERPGTVGRTVLSNLMESRSRSKVYAVNPSHSEVLGLKAYKSIGDISEKVDLAVVITPAVTVSNVVGECVDAGVRAAVVISAGFRERGPEGAALEQQIQQQLRRGTMRLIGPNCLGIMNPAIGLNATFARGMPKAGNVAFLSQSGALTTAILDWSQREEVGFSAIVSTGSMLDVGWGDLIDYFGDDPHTHSILVYMESVGDARSFLSAAREVSLSKPIIVIKAGRSEAASRAAASHTGALTGNDEVLDSAFRRCGVLRVHNIADLFYMAETLSKQPRPKGSRLMIITNAGGPAVLATDALIANGGQLATPSEESLRRLDQFLPRHWSHNVRNLRRPECQLDCNENENSEHVPIVRTIDRAGGTTSTMKALGFHGPGSARPGNSAYPEVRSGRGDNSCHLHVMQAEQAQLALPEIKWKS
jgi:acetyltransferase